MRFSSADQECLQQLRFDPTAEPGFELLKSCLIWPDERAERLSNEGRELLGDLWIVRGYIHKGVPPAQWKYDPDYFQQVWSYAQQDVPDWPGFKRLQLSARDRAYLIRSLAEVSKGNF